MATHTPMTPIFAQRNQHITQADTEGPWKKIEVSMVNFTSVAARSALGRAKEMGQTTMAKLCTTINSTAMEAAPGDRL